MNDSSNAETDRPQCDHLTSEQAEEKPQIIGITHDLDGGRSVFVGQIQGESSVFISFSNGELDTKLRLSFEAATALRELLGSISSRGLMSTSTWVFVTEGSSWQKQGDRTDLPSAEASVEPKETSS